MSGRPEDDDVFGDSTDMAWIERLLDGADGADGLDRDEVGPTRAGLANVLLAARAPASPDELAGEAAVMAMFRSTVAPEAASRSLLGRRAKAIVVAASLGATAMTGAAAAAGRLPPDVQDMAAELLDRIGIHVPTAERSDRPGGVPIEGPAVVSGPAGAGTDAPTGGLPDRRPLTGNGVSAPSTRTADGLAAPVIPDVTPTVPQEAVAEPAVVAPPPTDAAAPASDGSAAATVRDAAAAPSSPGPAAAEPTAPAAPAAPPPPAEEPSQAADHGQQEEPPRAEPARPAVTAPGRGKADPPAGPPADVPANSHASSTAGPPADVPGDPPAGPPADRPAGVAPGHADPPAGPPAATPGRPDGVGSPASRPGGG